MPIVKTDLFKSKDIRLATLAKALAHPASIAILRTLAKRDECVCGELVDVIPLAQATVSQHLKELKSVGLIKGEVDGPRSCYCLNGAIVDEYEKSLGLFLGELKNCCNPTNTTS